MFCNQCGANLPEVTAYCTMCGAPMYQQAPQQENYNWENNYQQSPVPEVPVKKNSLPITITMLVSIVLIIASILAPLMLPVFDIPVMSVALSAADEDPDELLDDMKDQMDEIKDNYDMIEDDLSSKEKKSYKKAIDSLEKMVDSFSLLNINAAAKAAQDMEDADTSDLDEAMEEFTQIMGVIVGISIGAFVLPLLFALLGGLKKSAGLTIAALIFTAISQLILSGVVLVILSAVVYIVQIVLCKKYKAA